MNRYNINKIINWAWAALAVLVLVGCVKIYHDKVFIDGGGVSIECRDSSNILK